VVATSNVEPAELYRDGLNRALFLPFIELLTARMDVVRLEARTDFRLEKLIDVKMWHVPADETAKRALMRLGGGSPAARTAMRSSSTCKATGYGCRAPPWAWRGSRFTSCADSRSALLIISASPTSSMR
jgi:cell division protein ZapE